MYVDFYKKIDEVIKRDARYQPDAYEFLLQALWYTQKKLNRNNHVSARELLKGIKEFALEQYGPMTKNVLKHWGIEKTEDFGNMVFNMIDSGIMRKTEKDSLGDFKNVYSFKEVFDSKKQFMLNRNSGHLLGKGKNSSKM